MERSGDYLYCILSPTELLQIVDVSNPTAPLVVGSLPADGGRLDIEGNLLYHTQGNGLRILDISTPTSPVVVGSHVPAGMDIVVQDGYVYAAEFSKGLRIIDATDPANPIEVALHPTGGGAQDVDISGTYAYLVNMFFAGDGLYVVDVSDPVNPVTAGFVPDSDYADVKVDGIYAYVLDYYGMLNVFDVTNPANPILVASSSVCGFEMNYDLEVSGGVAAVASHGDLYSGALCLIDVSNPLAPSELDYYESLPRIHSVDIANGYIALSFDEGALLTINRYDTDQRHWMPGTHWFVDHNKIVVQGDYAYIGNCDSWTLMWSGLAVVDVSDPTNPFEIGFLPVSSCVTDLAVGSSYVYFCQWENIVVVDVSDPTNPTAIGELAMTTTGFLFADEPYLYVANMGEGLKVVDVSDPTTPTVVGNGFPFGGDAWRVWVSNGYAYVVGNDYNGVIGLWIVDVSDPLNPSLVTTFSTNSLTHMVRVRDSYLYLKSRDLFQILDVSDPSNPIEVGNIDFGSLQNQIAIAPPNIYAITWVDGAASGPLLKLQTDLITAVSDVPVSPLRLKQNYPNPFNPSTTISFTLPSRMHVNLSIYDVQGMLVTTLVDETLPGAKHEIRWDGRDSKGKAISSGVYFCRLAAGGNILAKKMILIK